MLCCGLELFAPVPDATTRCRFRNALVQGGFHDDLAAGVCRAPQDRAKADAPDNPPDDPGMHFSTDTQARRVRNGAKPTPGYAR
ncbi:MAG: hypothetical protein GDA36_03865 [Rhodobacteraceae bacterium]|nr:hypothetical protein [Paracoccaceae bacterium]